MSNNAEDAIMRAQLAAAKAQGKEGAQLDDHHANSVSYLNERIWIFFGGIAILGLVLVWATAESELVIYGSFAGVIILTVLWGRARIRRIERQRREREQQAADWKSEN
ncbi:MAG: hypothetical protein AAF353_13090 [Pseudomonadota bacterium]